MYNPPGSSAGVSHEWNNHLAWQKLCPGPVPPRVTTQGNHAGQTIHHGSITYIRQSHRAHKDQPSVPPLLTTGPVQNQKKNNALHPNSTPYPYDLVTVVKASIEHSCQEMSQTQSVRNKVLSLALQHFQCSSGYRVYMLKAVMQPSELSESCGKCRLCSIY